MKISVIPKKAKAVELHELEPGDVFYQVGCLPANQFYMVISGNKIEPGLREDVISLSSNTVVALPSNSKVIKCLHELKIVIPD